MITQRCKQVLRWILILCICLLIPGCLVYDWVSLLAERYIQHGFLRKSLARAVALITVLFYAALIYTFSPPLGWVRAALAEISHSEVEYSFSINSHESLYSHIHTSLSHMIQVVWHVMCICSILLRFLSHFPIVSICLSVAFTVSKRIVRDPD